MRKIHQKKAVIIGYFIINKVEQEKKRKELMEHLKGKRDWEK